MYCIPTALIVRLIDVLKVIVTGITELDFELAYRYTHFTYSHLLLDKYRFIFGYHCPFHFRTSRKFFLLMYFFFTKDLFRCNPGPICPLFVFRHLSAHPSDIRFYHFKYQILGTQLGGALKEI